MKICYIVPFIKRKGGIEKITLAKSDWLLKNDDEILIISLYDKEKDLTFNPIDQRIKLYCLGIEHFRGNFLKRKIINSKINRKLENDIFNILEIEKPAVIVSTMRAEYRFLYKDKFKGKKIIERHNSYKGEILAYKKNWIYSMLKNIYYKIYFPRILNRYDLLALLTKEDLAHWRRVKSKECIPNFLGDISQKTSELKNNKVIALGRLSYQKGFDTLIEVWDIVSKKHSDWILEIYGEGEEKENLEKLIRQKKLQKNIKIYPTTKNIEKVYLESSIYVMTSHYEGLPLVLIEAMSYGLPLVSFNCPCGPTDLIKDNGFLIKNRDINLMAEKICLLIENESLRKSMGKKSREYSFDYSKDIIMQKWKKIYSN